MNCLKLAPMWYVGKPLYMTCTDLIYRTYVVNRWTAYIRDSSFVNKFQPRVHCIAMAANITKPEVVFILGGPGAGKGTLCRSIVEHYGYVHLSAGDLLREERSKPDSKYGELIETHIRNGTIVPVSITCSLLERAMLTSDSPHKRFLIDGFPRNEDNLDGWNKMMADKVVLKGVIFCDCNEQICTKRCLKRGAGGSGRSDDNEQSLILRHQTYLKNTLPIIEMYQKQGLVFKVNSMQKPKEVFAEIQAFFPTIGWH